MSTLLGVHSLSKSYGTQVLFKGISFTLSKGDRIGLLGPNGSGKSTLLKILMGQETQDSGEISRRQGLKVGYASQAPEFPPLTLEEVLAGTDPNDIEKLTKARILLGKAQFSDFLQLATSLSGGWKKRLDIARALMEDPDLLLLDEPTNHLDIEGILWLEKFLLREKIAYVVVSHDRYFLENVSNKIMELSRSYPQGLFVSEGNMSAFMTHKEAFLEAQSEQERSLASVLRDEIAWLKRSPKARTTKSQSRVQRTYAMMEELSEIKQRNKKTKLDIEFSASERETRKLLTAKNLSKSLGGKTLFSGIDITLSPGSRVGIVGKNGSGKTTLLKVLSGDIPQDMGTIKYAEDLRLVYFDQHREQVPNNITLKEALSPNGDTVFYRGQPMHVHGWARKFLFTPDRLDLPVSALSGGERARILIAKLMLKPADILFLDEPTNDLDIPTLEIMEECLKEFTGATVLISHDRCLMDRVCTQILGLGQGNEQQFYADYEQWEKSCLENTPKKEAPSIKSQEVSTPPLKKAQKLSYKEQKELEGMEKNILKTEEEIEKIQKELIEPINAQRSLELYTSLAEAQKKLETLYERWQQLSSK